MRKIGLVMAIALAAALCGCPFGQKDSLDQLDGVWRSENSEMILIHFSADPRMLKVGSEIIPVMIESEAKDLVTFSVSSKGRNSIQTLTKNWNQGHDQFSLTLTMDDGTQHQLGRIRPLTQADIATLSSELVSATPVGQPAAATAPAPTPEPAPASAPAQPYTPPEPRPNTPAPAPPPAAGGCPSYDAAAARYLGDYDLQACNCTDLSLLRNEIFARHGRIFKRDDLQRYFEAQSWYIADPNNINGERGQSPVEKKNVAAISAYEKRVGCNPSAPPPRQTQRVTPPPPRTSAGGCPNYFDAAGRVLSDYDLAGCDCSSLTLLRNEIFARHGRIFQRADLQNYFSRQSWYSPNPNDPEGKAGQSSTERKNVNTILAMEKRSGCR